MKKNSSKKLKVRIPRFKMDELIEIQKSLRDNNIKYDKKTIQIAASMYEGYQEYDIIVYKDDLLITVRLIKEYFGISNENSEKFSGNCPACNFELLNVTECIDCGLTLAGDYSNVYAEHPFVEYLNKEELS